MRRRPGGATPRGQTQHAILYFDRLQLFLEDHAAGAAGLGYFRRRPTQHVHRLPLATPATAAVAAILLAALGLALLVLPASAETAPSFDLPRWQTGQRVRLEDFAGQILVLDFFAYWCVPCLTASKE